MNELEKTIRTLERMQEASDREVFKYMKDDLEIVKKREENLKYIIRQTLWMARRYANGRSTFAVSDFNEAVHLLDDMGLGNLMPQNNEEDRFANDGMLGKYDFKTRRYKGLVELMEEE